MKRSLRLRLLLILLSLFSLVWVLVTAASYSATQHEIEELFDVQLMQYARTLQALTQHELNEDGYRRVHLDNSFLGHKYEKKVLFQVWRGDTLVMRSDGAPTHSLTDAQGISDHSFDGAKWRVVRLEGGDTAATIQVAERYDLRGELVGKISLQVLHPLLIALPVLAVILWFAVSGGLRPLRILTKEVKARSPYELQPLPDANIPREISPLVGAINRLLGQLGRALDGERRFTADAAHELRTPLAALKAQAQVAQGAKQPRERDAAIANIVSSVDRGTHMVEQLLTLARLDPEATHQQIVDVDLAALAAQVVGEQAAAALHKEVDLGYVEGGLGTVRGLPDALRVLLRNLVDNAVKYTPAGGRVDVAVHETAQAVVLEVSDTGPGIDPGLRDRVFDRFYRVTGNEIEGSGLGLSIVQRIAELHEAELRFDPEHHPGLKVIVTFPRL